MASDLQSLRNLPQKVEDLRVEVAVLKERLDHIDELLTEIKATMATKSEVQPLKWLATTFVGAIILGFVGTILAIVRDRSGS